MKIKERVNQAFITVYEQVPTQIDYFPAERIMIGFCKSCVPFWMHKECKFS